MQLLTIDTKTTEIIYRKISDVSAKAVAKTSWTDTRGLPVVVSRESSVGKKSTAVAETSLIFR